MGLPTGTVTFLFTDIEGSTKLLQDLGDLYDQVQDQHMRLMREAIASGGGTEIKTEGDSFFAVFPTASGALRAAVSAQRALHHHGWPHGQPVRVRIGMHTGEGRVGGDDYLGIDVNRAARIAAAGHGGQVVLSTPTRSLVEHDLPEGVSLRDLGDHRLKDLARPEQLHDVVIDGLPSAFPPLKTLDVPIDLPPQLTSFVGREREVEQVIDFLGRSRLVTLIGPGGTGKTRLAVETGGRVADRFPDGVQFVDLAPITDPRLIPDTIASALRVREEPGRLFLDTLTDHLRDRTVLLVLDNFEQILEGAGTVAALLRAAANLRVLVTSRAPLGVSGEQEWPVPPLEVPRPDGDVEALRHSDAVSLFAERAAAVDPSFSLTVETLPTVAEICSRLDGLPLAIELAASRLRLLSPQAVLEQLERRLPVLVGGPRDRPDRQRTLRGAIAWSYDLLDQDAAALFRRLSVFAGGWSLESVDEVANPDGDLGDSLSLLELLLQHSLVQRVPGDGDGRLRMLETIREFALERLEGTDEGDELRRRHTAVFLRMAEEGERHLRGAERARWVSAFSRDHDNFRAALRWAVDSGDADTGLRLGRALWRFWQMHGHLNEGRRWLDELFAMPSSRDRTTVRAVGLSALGGVAYWQGDFDTAIAAYQEALDIRREAGDRAGTVEALFELATTLGVTGDVGTAWTLLQESLAAARELGDRRGEAWALWGLGASLFFRRDLEDARAHLEHSLRLFEEVREDRWGTANALIALGGVAFQSGDPAEARTWVLRAVELWGEDRNVLTLSVQLRFLAALANAMGQHERAVRLAAAAARMREEAEGQAPSAFFPFPEPKETAAEFLDPASLERAWAEGAAMDLDQALAYAREES